jgi:hypothetical protein
MFWAWLLKYASFLVTGAVSFVVGYVLYLLTTKRSDLIYYTSHPQWVTIPLQSGGQPVPPTGTFTLFIWNAGRAPAKEVQIGHHWLPANNMYPDLPRDIVQTPGGGFMIKIPSIPPKTVLSVSYLFHGYWTAEQIISYVNWEHGTAKKIPVMLQRIWPKWYRTLLWVLIFAGVWVAINVILTLVKFLWLAYYK